MAVRVYLMPIIGTGAGSTDPRRPKYVTTFASFAWDLVDYGFEPVCFVGVQNIDAPTHAALVANADVTAMPVDLTTAIGAQLTLVKNTVAGFNIPENWILGTHTYNQVLRVCLLIFLFMQRFHATLPNTLIFTGGITLASTISQLPVATRTALSTTATSLGFSTAGLTGATTLRTALKALADQFPTIEVQAFSSTL